MLKSCQEHQGFKFSISAAAGRESHDIEMSGLLVRPK